MPRKVYIDITKGVGMLLVVWGHVYHGLLSDFIFSFHMPLFFVVSGMLYNPQKFQNLGSFANNRLYRLIIPYIKFAIITWLVWVFYNYITHNDMEKCWYAFGQIFIAQGSCGFLMHNAPLWFITCLFCTEILFCLIYKYCKRYHFLVCALLSITAMYVIKYNAIPYIRLLPWNLEVSFVALIFYSFGFILRFAIEKYDIETVISSHSKRNILSFVSLSIIFLFFTLFFYNITGGVDMGSDYFTFYPILFPLTGISGTLMIISLSVVFSYTLTRRFSQFLEWFGKNTFDVLMIHVPIKGAIIVLMAKLLNVELIGDAYFYDALYAIIAFILTLLIVCVCVWVINKSSFLSRILH